MRVCERCFGDSCKNEAVLECVRCSKDVGLQCRHISFSKKSETVICDTCILKERVEKTITETFTNITGLRR